MKKMIMAVAIVCATAFANAAAVGWSAANMGSLAGNAYMVFVIGQNNVTDMATVTSLLADGADVSTYAFGSGKVAANGSATVLPANSGKELGAGTYTSFMVVFDTTEPVAGTSKYAVIAGAANQTKVIAATTAATSFTAGNASSFVTTDKFSAFGSAGPIAPEPTSGLLLLLGMAGLALKRKVA